jgi:hypothetical protein
MNRTVRNVTLTALVGAVCAVVASASISLARPPINCPDVWMPVICSDGNIYSNYCYASAAGATGCVPWGGDDI